MCTGLCSTVVAFTTVRTVPPRGEISSSLSAAVFKIPLLGRFRKKKDVFQEDTIKIGESLPSEADVVRAENGDIVSLRDIVGTGKALLVGMPGAFTPTCTSKHLPGFVEYADKFKSVGYSKIACLTTNDRFVSDEWGKVVGIENPADSKTVDIYSDGDGDVVKALGLAEDMGFGLGVRSKRFAMALEDGKVTHLLTDEGIDQCENTSAANMLAVLSPSSVETESSMGSGAVLGAIIVAIAAAAVAQLGTSGLLEKATS